MAIVFCLLVLLLAVPLGAVPLCGGLAGPGAAKAVGVQQGQPRLNKEGKLHALVIFAQFAGEGDGRVPAYANSLFDPQQPGSLAHFYSAMSFGRLQLSGTVLPRRYAAPGSAAAYAAPGPGQRGGFGRLAAEVLAQVDAELDFGRFDNDGPDGVPDSGDDDGWVDYVFLNMRSTPNGFLVGGATGIAGLDLPNKVYVTDDVGADGQPIRIGGETPRGVVSGEGTFAQTVGTMAHEFGHSLGLPDLFDTSALFTPDQAPDQDSAGIGRWGLMGWGAHGWDGNSGPAPLSAWSLEQLGWISPTNGRLVEVADDLPGQLITDVHRGGAVLKIPLRVHTPDSITLWQEYLLLEQRQAGASYYYRNMPGDGLLVWHIRPQIDGNVDEAAKQVDLVCADGLYTDAGFPSGRAPDRYHGRDNLDFWSSAAAYRNARGGNQGDATDPFDGVRFRRLTLDSNPSSLPEPLLAAATTGVALENMRPEGGSMRLDITLPRWAGTIRGEVHWAGNVLIDGDLTVGPQGRLVLYRDTRVMVEGTDRLAAGSDPDKSEIRIEGDLVLRELGVSQLSFVQRDFARGDTTLFAARRSGQTWAGLFIQPGPDAELILPYGGYQIRDAESGLVVIDGLPPDPSSLRLEGFQFMRDGSDPNGNRQLDPGESVRLVPEFFNESPLFFMTSVQAHLSWSSPLLSPSSGNTRTRTINIPPGRKQAFLFRSVVELDPQAPPGEIIRFSLRLTKNNARLWEGEFELEVPNPTAVADDTQPTDFDLAPNYPNPFNARTTIAYSLPQPAAVRLHIFNASGQPVRRLVQGQQPAGPHHAVWDGTDDRGIPLGSGVYFYRLETGTHRQTRSLVLLK